MFTGNIKNDAKERSKENLFEFLKKLGIKSADFASVHATLQMLMNAIQNNHGTPDKLYMDPASHAALSKFLKPDPKLTKKNK